jgi:hypothetical protein
MARKVRLLQSVKSGFSLWSGVRHITATEVVVKLNLTHTSWKQFIVLKKKTPKIQYSSLTSSSEFKPAYARAGVPLPS